VENVSNPKKESGNTEDDILNNRHESPREEDTEDNLNHFEHDTIIPYPARISRE